MSVLAFVLLAFQSPAAAGQSVAWDALAKEYDLAFETWVRENTQRGDSPGAAHPAAEYWGRFEALAEKGEGRANVWMLANVDSDVAPSAAPSAESRAALLERVRRGGDQDWVGTALFQLGANAKAFDQDVVAEVLEARIAPAYATRLRALAGLALAEVVALEDPEQAAHLRVWGAVLFHDGLDLALDDELAREDAIELGDKVVDAIEKEARNYFAVAYWQGSDGDYYPLSGAAPDPKARWRPAIEELAFAGSPRAMLWALSNAPWNVDAGVKTRLCALLDALAQESLTAEQLGAFGRQTRGLVMRIGLAAVEPAVRQMIGTSPEVARPALLFGLGESVCESAGADAGQRERGIAILREVRERWPDSKEATRAEGWIFRYTNLVVGKAIPDFETVDADGNAFKLSDYEGKVTVVDFWGFW